MANLLDRILGLRPTKVPCEGEQPVPRKDKLVTEIGAMVRASAKADGLDCDQLSLVLELGEGCFSNFGLLYYGEKIAPFDAGCPGRPLALRDAARELRNLVTQETGHSFKKLLLQMEYATGRMKIQFEFDDPTRWSVRPAQLKAWREELRPDF